MNQVTLPPSFEFNFHTDPHGTLFYASVQSYTFKTVVHVCWFNTLADKPEAVLYTVQQAIEAIMDGAWILANVKNIH